MKILMVASEATPYAKTGGLADVIGALPFALQHHGDQVAVVLPYYRKAQVKAEASDRVYDRLQVRLSATRQYSVNIRRIIDRGVHIYFADCPELYDRDELYGGNGVDYPDNHVRYAVLSRTALAIIRSLFRPDVVHCHDWQSGLVGPMIRHQFRLDPTFAGIRNVLTIHNLGYQGIFPPHAVTEIGLDPALMRTDGLEFWGRVNYLKGGIVFADAITTVSPTYAKEVQTREFGFGLDGLLRSRASVLTGIINGVDYAEWSPETDPHIAANYSAEDLRGKRECKADLLREFGLGQGNLKRPVLGIVSRFVTQKGFDLIAEIADELMSEDVCLTAIGSGEPELEDAMTAIATAYPDRAGVKIAYNNAIAHKIEAGADIFLMPSRYEPCGLNQIYSLRYGMVPVVRATGGLDDTITPESGFKFREYTPDALLKAIRAALTAWRDKEGWRKMMLAGMRSDYSWDASAAEYSALYRRLMPV